MGTEIADPLAALGNPRKRNRDSNEAVCVKALGMWNGLATQQLITSLYNGYAICDFIK